MANTIKWTKHGDNLWLSDLGAVFHLPLSKTSAENNLFFSRNKALRDFKLHETIYRNKKTDIYLPRFSSDVDETIFKFRTRCFLYLNLSKVLNKIR